MSKRICVIVIALSMVLLPWQGIEVHAETTILYSGISGDLNWSIDSNGLLTISGEGDYKLDYRPSVMYSDCVPKWVKYEEEIQEARINVKGITSLRYMFYGLNHLTRADLSGLDTSNVTDMSAMFGCCTNMTELDVSNFDTSKVTNMKGMFSGCGNITELDVSNFDTSSVMDMSHMFSGCGNITELDLSNFDTSSVMDMSHMFSSCDKLIKLDLSSFNSSIVTDMSYMFFMCQKLSHLNLSNFDTSSVTNMSGMFSVCNSLTKLDLSNFNTSNVTTMYGMFRDCEKLIELNMSAFDTSKVANMGYMFDDCKSLINLNVSTFDTSKVTNMEYMFQKCTGLTRLDLSSCNMSKVKKTGWMFTNCINLTNIRMPANVNIATLLHLANNTYWTDENGNVVTQIKQQLPTPMTYTRREGNAKIDVNNGNIHCCSSYDITVNVEDSIPITVTADTNEELAAIINSIEAQSANTGVVTVEDLSFVMPTKAITYSGSNTTYSKWTASGLLKVKGVTEGSTAITILESGGGSVACQITVSDETSGSDISAGNEGFCLGEEVSGSADSSVADFFPADWSLASTVYPVEIEMKEEDNGLYKLRIAIGVKKGNWLKEDATWNEFKSNVKDFKAYTSRYKGITEYKKKWGLKSYDAITASGFKKKPQISVMAYYEGTFDKNKKLINSESEFETDASWKGSLSWQFTTPIGPLYLNLSPGCTISVSSSIAYDWEKEAFSFPGGKLTVTPSVSLEGGYGIDKVASVGAKGTLSFPVSVIPCTKGELKASASVHCCLLFVIDFEKKLASYKKELWNTIDEPNLVSKGLSLNAIAMNPNVSM